MESNFLEVIMKKFLSILLFITIIASFNADAMEKIGVDQEGKITLEAAFQLAQLEKRRFGLDKNTTDLIEHKLTEKAAQSDMTADELSINRQDAINIIVAERKKFVLKRNKENQEKIDRLIAEQLEQEESSEQGKTFDSVDFQEQKALLRAFEQENQAKKDRKLAEQLAQEDNEHTNQSTAKKSELTKRQRRLQHQKKQNEPRNQKVQPQQSNQNGRIIVNGKQCRGLQWTVKIGNKNIPVKQVFVLPQSGTNGGDASCGYHTLHNGIILKNANHNMATLLNTSRNFANEKQFILQERRQGIQNQRARARVHAQNLETFEIHQLCQRFHLNELRFDESGYSYTILDQAGSITTNNVENIMGESLDIVKVRLRQLQDYTHIFAVRIPGKKATHWFTVVVHKQNGQTEYLVADSAGNHRRVRDQMLITLIDELEK